MPPRTRVRASFACARCYRGKKRCDNILPTCTSCKRAGVECMSIDRDTKGEVPRSVVKFLEETIAAFELQLGQADKPGDSSICVLRKCRNYQTPRTWCTPDSTKVAESGFDVIPPLHVDASPISVNVAKVATEYASRAVVDNFDRIPYRQILTSCAELPLSLSQSVSAEICRGDTQRSGLRDIPKSIAKVLFDKYVDKILPQYPYFLEGDLRWQFALVYDESAAAVPHEAYFVVAMVLAIVTLTCKTPNFSDVLSVAEPLHQDALRHDEFLKYATLRSMQCILLLQQFAALLPYTGNLWHLAGEAMRIAIELGLHKEPWDDLSLDLVSVDLRRRIFWATYAIERSLTVTSHRPFTLMDEHINTQYPSEYEDCCIRRDHIDTSGRRIKFQFLNVVRFRQIQSEICSVQYFNRPLGDLTYDQWQTEVEGRIEQLHQDILSMIETAPEWLLPCVWNNRVMLHRPCCRNPNPSKQSLRACFHAAFHMAKGCWSTAQTSYLTFTFHIVHNAFEAGTTMLYILKEKPTIARALFPNQEIVSNLTHLSAVFTLLSERWAAAAYAGDLFDNLKRTVLKTFLRPGQIVLTADDSANLKELDDIVLHKVIEDLYSMGQQRPRPTPAEVADSNTYSFTMCHEIFPAEEDRLQELYNFDIDIESSFSYPFPDASLDDINGDQSAVCAEILPIDLSRHHDYPATEFIWNDALYISALRSRLQELIQTQRQRAHEPSSLEQLTSLLSGECEPVAISGPGTGLITSPQLSNHLVVGDIVNAEKLDATLTFYGHTSVFVQMGQMSHQALHLAAFSTPGHGQSWSSRTSLLAGIPPLDTDLPPPSVATTLMTLFGHSINIFYPICRQEMLDELYVAASDGDSTASVTLSLILAISTHIIGKADRRMAAWSSTYFLKAMREWQWSNETCRSKTLRIAILTCIYILLNPAAGDVWRVLGLVSRLCLDLANIKVERQSQEEREENALLHRTAYCLECEISIAFGRPTQLPDRHNFVKYIQANTASEKVSSHIYKLNRLKAALLNKTLSDSGTQMTSENAESWRQYSQDQLKKWMDCWMADLNMTEIANAEATAQMPPVVNSWGKLLYHGGLLLMERSHPWTGTLQHGCNTAPGFIEACTDILAPQTDWIRRLVLGGQAQWDTEPAFSYFPITWPTVHSLLSAGLTLAISTQASRDPGDGHESLLRQCTKLLATLETDQDTLSYGFSRHLEAMMERKG
ncbi:uncharacterized protein PV07_04087 [Cladophialophora immunda]|uniref:Zn(2)-C6 fungal-type domain-containing protein n=1 Tax=Cladophialophora immunda TaxID=569365 RepID=A0A0D1ZWN9_9EURO|nr:uncharacterized protein PV07_04087 [Cladophialophora immunda]KIW32556.1 hypothetical protein PV07_04087 [Cladophialophora immunda]